MLLQVNPKAVLGFVFEFANLTRYINNLSFPPVFIVFMLPQIFSYDKYFFTYATLELSLNVRQLVRVDFTFLVSFKNTLITIKFTMALFGVSFQRKCVKKKPFWTAFTQILRRSAGIVLVFRVGLKSGQILKLAVTNCTLELYFYFFALGL